MSLNVKDPEAHRLAQAIAQATGQSMTRLPGRPFSISARAGKRPS
ncbi:type II toxin-antitoxin system VapB family antitoxin [Novosphingobium sp.]